MNRAMAFPVLLLACLSGGCAVVAIADAGVTVAATAVKVGAKVVGGVSDAASAGMRVITNNVGRDR